MFKKLNGIVLAGLLTTLLFSACTGSLPFIGQATSSNGGGSGNNQAALPAESKTVIGLLKLEGTAQAITADQAKTLLPLYKAVKVLSTTTGSSPVELKALYVQVNDSLTAEQTQAIAVMDITPQNMRCLLYTSPSPRD